LPAKATLRFAPSAPGPGETVAVIYAPAEGAGSLANASSLVLRARLRRPTDPSRPSRVRKVHVATLRRTGGPFTGRFRLPDDVVYGAFVVETLDGQHVDGNGGRPWELLVRGPDGRPLAAALQQLSQDYMGLDMGVVLETSQRLTVLYPDEPLSWMLFQSAQEWTVGSAAQAELDADLARRFAMLDALFRTRRDLTGIDAAAMMWQAMLVGDSSAHRYWRARLDAVAPGHPMALRERLYAVQRHQPYDPGMVLDTMDAIWREARMAPPPTDPIGPRVLGEMAGVAFQAAVESGRTDEQLVWADRWQALDPRQQPELALIDVPAHHAEALRRLRARIAAYRTPDDARRELGVTRAEQAVEDDREAGSLLGYLGTALIQDGHVAAGVDTLEAALRLRPGSRGALRALAAARLAMGDTTAALDAWARLAAEVSSPDALEDTVRARAGGRFDPREWEKGVQRARDRSLQLVMRDAIDRPVPPGLRLTTTDGRVTTLDAVRGDAPEAVVVFWTRFCVPAMEAMPAVQTMARSLAHQGVPVVAVTGDVPDAAFRAVMSNTSFRSFS